MDAGSIVEWVVLGLTLAGGIFKFGALGEKIANLERDHCALEAHNTKQHEELYNSRNNTNEILAKLTALFESMKEKQESMDSKLDLLLKRKA